MWIGNNLNFYLKLSHEKIALFKLCFKTKGLWKKFKIYLVYSQFWNIHNAFKSTYIHTYEKERVYMHKWNNTYFNFTNYLKCTVLQSTSILINYQNLFHCYMFSIYSDPHRCMVIFRFFYITGRWGILLFQSVNISTKNIIQQSSYIYTL